MKRIAWGLAIILSLLLVANAFVAWRVDAQLAAKRAAIRKTGAPASIADLRPRPIPNADNAAAQMAALGPQLEAFGKDQAHFLDKTAPGKAFSAAHERGEPPTGEQADAMRAILAQHAVLAAGLERAAACNGWASQLDFSLDHPNFISNLLPPVQTFRNAARMIDWQMRLNIYDGKFDAGVAQGIMLLRLTRLHENEPTLVNYLATIAARGAAIRGLHDVLVAGPVSPEMHAALDAELALADNPQSFINALRMERGAALDSMGAPPQGAQAVLFRMFGWSMKRLYLRAFDFFDDLIAEAGKPWPEFRETTTSDLTRMSLGKYGTLGELLAPAVTATIEARGRDWTQIRALRVFNALRAYAEEHGREATGLQNLGLAAAATADPLTDQPLVLKHTDAGWTVYGVGRNGKDDGGKIDDALPLDYGVGPREAKPQ